MFRDVKFSRCAIALKLEVKLWKYSLMKTTAVPLLENHNIRLDVSKNSQVKNALGIKF